jgi:hypothetical protein
MFGSCPAPRDGRAGYLAEKAYVEEECPMKLEIIDTIPYSRDVVFSTLRDKLPEVVPFLPNIEDIKVESRQEPDATTVKVVNLWKANSDIPRVVRSFITPEMLSWTDYAEWDEQEFVCRWDLKTNFFTEQVECTGQNRYVALGEKETQIVIEGDLNIDAGKIKGIPKLMAKSAGAAIEKFVVGLVTPNFKKLNQSLVTYLSQEK